MDDTSVMLRRLLRQGSKDGLLHKLARSTKARMRLSPRGDAVDDTAGLHDETRGCDTMRSRARDELQGEETNQRAFAIDSFKHLALSALISST